MAIYQIEKSTLDTMADGIRNYLGSRGSVGMDDIIDIVETEPDMAANKDYLYSIISDDFNDTTKRTLTLPSGITSLNNASTTSADELKLFQYKSFYEVVLSPTITGLYESIFDHCTNLETINLDNITIIRNKVFGACNGLRKIFIPSTCTTITGTPFYACDGTLKIYTDAASKPNGWDSTFNQYGIAKNLTVYYGVSKQEFDAL